MKKFDLSGIAADVKKQFKDSKISKKIGTGDNLTKLEDSDFIIMPEWFQTISQVKGLPFGKLVMIAGDSDTGKTSAAIEAMKAAQAQGVGVLFVETEGKTTSKDLEGWGVDPSGVLLVQSGMAEEAFTLMFAAWDGFRKAYPAEKLLIVFDSIGNVISQRDSEIDLVEQSSQPGMKGKINRLGMNKMVARMSEDQTAVLVINYTYANIGSPGKTNAGGKALNFFSSLTFQTTRVGWLERQVQGKKVRTGVVCKWECFKNHLCRSEIKAKSYEVKVSSEGIEAKENG